uniref:Immunoglobulin V-set domain-containing protein n=1 Tax=Ursus americanus TaxID=9643 RepID=A0A452SD23_URSAM
MASVSTHGKEDQGPHLPPPRTQTLICLLPSFLVSLLTFWNPPTTAQLTVESVPPDAAEGKDVLLRVHSLPGDLVGLSWFRGASLAPSRQILSYVVDTQVTIPGPAYSGRETIYPNGSLLFQRVTVKDTGYYTLQIVRRDDLPLPSVYITCGFILFAPDDPDSPTVSPSDSHYHQGASLRLSATQTLTHPHYILGLSMGGPSHPHKSSLSPNITGNDSGAYTCIASNSGTGLNKTTVKTITVSGRSVWLSEKNLEEVISHQQIPNLSLNSPITCLLECGTGFSQLQKVPCIEGGFANGEERSILRVKLLFVVELQKSII